MLLFSGDESKTDISGQLLDLQMQYVRSGQVTLLHQIHRPTITQVINP
jgi:hypothetical protein